MFNSCLFWCTNHLNQSLSPVVTGYGSHIFLVLSLRLSQICVSAEHSQLFKKGASLSTQKMPYYAKRSEKFSCEVSQGDTEASQTFVAFKSLVPLLPHRRLSAFMSHTIVKKNMWIYITCYSNIFYWETAVHNLCEWGLDTLWNVRAKKMLDWLLIKCFNAPRYISLAHQRRNSTSSCDWRWLQIAYLQETRGREGGVNFVWGYSKSTRWSFSIFANALS